MALYLVDQMIPRPSVILARGRQLDAALLRRVAPDIIVFPLIAPRFDAVQMLCQLEVLGYCGTACVIMPPLPSPEMVRDELIAAAADIKLVMLELPDLPPRPSRPIRPQPRPSARFARASKRHGGQTHRRSPAAPPGRHRRGVPGLPVRKPASTGC